MRTVGRIRNVADVVEIPLAVCHRWRGSMKSLRYILFTPLLRPEEKRMVLPDRTAQVVPKVVLLVRRRRWKLIKIIARVEHVIAQKFVGSAMKLVRSGLRFHLNRAGRIASVLRTVVRRQHFHFLNRFQARSEERRVE